MLQAAEVNPCLRAYGLAEFKFPHTMLSELKLAFSVPPCGFSDKVFYLFLDLMVFYGVASCSVQQAAKLNMVYSLC